MRPYPTERRRGAASRSCGLTLGHVSNWTAEERAVIDAALAILDEKLRSRGAVLRLHGESAIRDFVRLQLGLMDREVFAMICLDAAHRLLGFEVLAVGCSSYVLTYPRQAVRQAIAMAATAVVFVHNHPSGGDESPSDRTVTATLKTAFDAVDIAVLDHLIVAEHDVWSFAELGLMPGLTP